MRGVRCPVAVVSKGGITLGSRELRERHAGPKSQDQWVDGRSAMETAKAWLQEGTGNLPGEVVAA